MIIISLTCIIERAVCEGFAKKRTVKKKKGESWLSVFFLSLFVFVCLWLQQQLLINNSKTIMKTNLPAFANCSFSALGAPIRSVQKKLSKKLISRLSCKYYYDYYSNVCYSSETSYIARHGQNQATNLRSQETKHTNITAVSRSKATG